MYFNAKAIYTKDVTILNPFYFCRNYVEILTYEISELESDFRPTISADFVIKP